MLGNMTTLARSASRRTMQRHLLLPHCRGTQIASLSSPMATLAQPQRPPQSGWLGGATALAITSSLACVFSYTTNSTLCEETPSATHTAEHNQDKEEEDPYENLPEEDEPTTCFLCLTYRKGPCRPSWRKFERCVKDNSPSDAAAQEQSNPDTPNPCGKYAMPFAQCSVEYFELYELIRNHTFQEDYFDQPESLQDEHNAIPSNAAIVDMDWTAWNQYSTIEPPSISKSTLLEHDNNNSTTQRLPLWQQLGTLHPELTHVQVTVHHKDPDTGYPLSVVYARDQDANFMGLAHPKTETNKEGKTAATSNDSNSNSNEKVAATNDDEESPSDPTINNPDSDTTAVVELKVTIVPSHTRSFVVYAVYKDEESPKDDGTTNQQQDPPAAVVPMRIYKSSPQFLADHRHPKDESSSAQ